MKKSPLSTPSGSRGKQSYNWKLNDHRNTTGYNNVKSDNYQYSTPKSGQIQLGNDFIPLNASSPLSEQKRFSGNWHGFGGRSHRNSGSGGFNHYRNNYHATPKTNLNNSYSPYKHYGKQFYGQKKGYHKDTRKQVDISSYVDMKSFLEDPWAELTKKLDKSKETKGTRSPKIEQSVSSQLIYIDSRSSSESKSRAADDSRFNSKCRDETSVNVTLGLDDTDVSDLSRTKSSIDLKLDDVRFSEESKDNSICSNNDSACDESIRRSCTSKADIIQDVI
ncbi:hypothetical protein ANTRET_LOCUS5699 [Anthophora retusa]